MTDAVVMMMMVVIFVTIIIVVVHAVVLGKLKEDVKTKRMIGWAGRLIHYIG
jgi:hypothetical protein